MTSRPRYALQLRARAAAVVAQVLGGLALPAAVEADRQRHGRHGLVEELAMGAVRASLGLDTRLRAHLRHPLKARDHDLHALLLIGLYQAWYLDTPAPVAVSEAVATADVLGKPWAKGLLNAVLRATVGDDHDALLGQAHNYPPWLVARIAADWPTRLASILKAGDQRAPLCLRIDRRRLTRTAYLAQLAAVGITALPHPFIDTAVLMPPANITALPGFADGQVSVQDAGAQLAGALLAPVAGEHILDACAAPGGKTLHLHELCPEATIVAADIDAARSQRLQDNLDRHQRPAAITVRVRDLTTDEVGGPFAAILLDAPCSATGVIRRHPDIKLHRRDADIRGLVTLQARLLDHLWPALAPGGRLLYVTCSILAAENEEQIGAFLDRTPTATETPLALPGGIRRAHGWQLLPGDDNTDGFFYARLVKTPT
ncbi:MAG: 16S rRNA (cytosine(967)-C(5))-methyltransferase RsmB [Acidiferrobacter sp.]